MSADGVVLITGAASGIGRCFAQTLAASARRLVLCDVDAAGLGATAASLQGPAAVDSVRVDVSDRPAVGAAIGQCFGAGERLDLLINCAAILGPGTWATQPAEEFERVLQIDLVGGANVVRAALPALRVARGRIVLLASTAALHGWPGLAAYSAAKFGVVGWAEGIRAELGREGIRLTLAFPLLIDTPLLDRPGTPPILRGRRIPPAVVVRKVLRAVERRRARVYIPGTVRLIAAVQGIAPSLLDRYGAWFGIARR